MNEGIHPRDAELDPRRMESGDSDKVILCLSGEGWRASLFHLGALLRWNELGLLSNLSEVHSVGAGSVVAGLLCVHWSDIARQGMRDLVNLDAKVARPLESFVGRGHSLRPSPLSRIRPRNWRKLLSGRFGETERFVEIVEDKLLGRALLGRVSPFQPDFRFFATNLRTGGLWEFARTRLGEVLLGFRQPGAVTVAQAVVGSMLCPATMTPMHLESARRQFEGGRTDTSLRILRDRAVLCDGSLRDPLAVEAAVGRGTCLLVSDGNCGVRPEPAYDDWTTNRLFRSIQIQTEQAIQTRRRGLVQSIRSGQMDGAYISLTAHHRDFGLHDSTGYSHDLIDGITRGGSTLPIPQWDVSLIVNHGYSIADAGARRLLSHRLSPSAPFVLPRSDDADEPAILRFPGRSLMRRRFAA